MPKLAKNCKNWLELFSVFKYGEIPQDSTGQEAFIFF